MLSTVVGCVLLVLTLSICNLVTGVPVECTKRCRFGFETDDNGLELCQCHDPCQDVTCDDDQVCYPQYELCVIGMPCPPPPVGVCVPDTVDVPSIRYKRSLRGGFPRPRTPPHDPRPPRPRWP
ncbi:hypothetical protein LSAT2_014686 [Lamellibrachia satsuma]|nr:hypothetical protein LSAT2_014686 [Lamellibrachia satsuma]